MAFELRIPFSRRQIWEKNSGDSQYSILTKRNSLPSPGEELHSNGYDDIDTGSGLEIQPAGAPIRLSVSSRSKNKANAFCSTTESGDATTVSVITTNTIPTIGTTTINYIAPSTHQISDNTALPAKIPFSKLDLFFVLLSIVLYLVDIGLDCFVAYKHYCDMADTSLYFIFTLVFILLSAAVTSLFSLWWYYFEYKTKLDTPQDLPSKAGCVLRIVASVFALGPVARYIDTIRYGLMSRKRNLPPERRRYYFLQMQYERVDGAMLRLFEAFLEAAPQTLLQVFIVLRKGIAGQKQGNYFLVIVTMVSILMSMLSLAWSIVAYHKALRMSRDDRCNITHCGLALRFLWRLFEISPRIILFAMFMAVYKYYLGVFIACHYVLMVVCIWKLKTGFCEKPKCETLFVLVVALVWSFCFFNLKDGHTRKRSLLFYLLFITENIILTVVWSCHPETGKLWYQPILISVVIGSTAPMVMFMLLYYHCQHPKKISLCLPASYWTKCNFIKKSSGDDNSDQTSLPDGPLHQQSGMLLQPAGSASQLAGPEQDINEDTHNCEETPDKDAVSNNTVSVKSDDDFTDSSKCIEKGNLDNCVEIDGYLETTRLPPSLQRQDTIPKYQAPVPVTSNASNYGATVPGGVFGVLTYSIQDSNHRIKGRGSTLPGSRPPPAAVLDNQQNQISPDLSPILPPRQHTSSFSQRDSHRPPVPEPRLSLVHQTTGGSDTSIGEFGLTYVTALEESSSLITPTRLSGSKSDTLDSEVTPFTSLLDSNGDIPDSPDTPLCTPAVSTHKCLSVDTPELPLIYSQD